MRTEGERLAHRDLGTAEKDDDLGNTEEARISIGDMDQVRKWAIKLGISSEHVRELVAQVGPRVCDLQKRLSQPETVD